MGQKVNPIGLRVGINKTWDSRWYVKQNKNFASNLHEDFKLRKYVTKKLKNAGISRVEIERAANKIKIIVSSARPGFVIGKKGVGIDSLRDEINKMTKNEVIVNIQEIRKPDTDAKLVAENIAVQLEKRVSWRRALKKALQSAIRGGVKGIKVQVAGRLDGAEIARVEWYTEKSVPLHTLRAGIDYGTKEAMTTYGVIGVKVWIYTGDIVPQKAVNKQPTDIGDPGA